MHITIMENSTSVPIVGACTTQTNEYESLWIIVMLVASAISTSAMMILGNKYRARKRARIPRARAPFPLPPASLGKGRGGEEEVEMV